MKALVDRLKDRSPKSGRGLHGAEFKDTYGARVRVSDSSSASAPHMWLWCEGGNIEGNNGSIHLNKKMAKELGEVLLKFARDGSLARGAK